MSCVKVNFKIYTEPRTTVSALIAGGNFEQLILHLQKAKSNGITKDEIAVIITQLSFYAGWPKAWSAFNIAKEINKNKN